MMNMDKFKGIIGKAMNTYKASLGIEQPDVMAYKNLTLKDISDMTKKFGGQKTMDYVREMERKINNG